jgi:hypothetical protein
MVENFERKGGNTRLKSEDASVTETKVDIPWSR